MKIIALICLLPVIASAQSTNWTSYIGSRSGAVTFVTPFAVSNMSLNGASLTTSNNTLLVNGSPVTGSSSGITNSTSTVSGLTLTTANGIVTLGGSIPASGISSNDALALIASNAYPLSGNPSGYLTSTLTTNVDFAGFSLNNVGTLSAANINLGDNSLADMLASRLSTNYNGAWLVGSGGITNGGNATLGTLNVGTITAGSGLQINGTLTVTGNTYQVTVINISTNVYAGTTTNYVNQTIYSTNVSYTTFLVTTNQTITNTVDTYVNLGGNFTVGNGASFWGTNASIYLPTLTVTGALSQATGTWDWTGATWVNPPTNIWTFGTPGALTLSLIHI